MEATFAKPQDIAQIISFAYSAYKETSPKSLSPDFVKVSETVSRCVVQEIVFVVRSPEDERVIEGVIVCEHASPWWTDDVMLHQLFFYTKPSKQRLKVLNTLLQAVEEYGKLTNVNVVQDIIGKRFSTKGKILEKRGYTLHGGSYILTPKRETTS